jgi:serine protease Do
MKNAFASLMPLARNLVLLAVPVVLAAQPTPPAAPTPPTPPSAPMLAPEALKMTMEGKSFLGVGVKEVEPADVARLRLKDEQGVEITKVEDDSPAMKAGLKVGDVVLEFNGQRVEGTEQFVRLVRETPAGRTVKLVVSRGGPTQTLTATIAARKAKSFAIAPMEGMHIEMPKWDVVMPDMPKANMSWRSGMLGIEGESLTESQLASYFGVKDGVLVRSVGKGTAAEKAGIKAGDVILKVNDTAVTSTREITAALRAARSGGKSTFPVVLSRDKRDMTLSVPMDELAGESALPRAPKAAARQLVD